MPCSSGRAGFLRLDRQKKPAAATSAKTPKATPTPIPALAPVDNPPPPFELLELVVPLCDEDVDVQSFAQVVAKLSIGSESIEVSFGPRFCMSLAPTPGPA